MATIDDTVGKLARVYDSATDTWVPLVGSPAPHTHDISDAGEVDITEPLVDNQILKYSTSASAFINTDSATLDEIDVNSLIVESASASVLNVIQPNRTTKPLIIKSTAPETGSVTNAVASSGSVTYEVTGASTIFTAGDLVTISGITPATLDDVRATVGSVSGGSIVIFSGKQGTYTSGGTATRIHANLLEIQNSSGTATSTIRSDGSMTGEFLGGLVHINTTSFSGVSSQSINDVFSATYKNYRIIVEAISAVGEVSGVLRLRVGGVDETGNNYLASVRSLGANGTSYNGTGAATSKIFVGRIGGNGRSLLTIDIANPFASERTTTISATAADGATTFFGENGSGLLFNTTSYTGFTLIPEGSTFSGSISVYGYNV